MAHPDHARIRTMGEVDLAVILEEGHQAPPRSDVPWRYSFGGVDSSAMANLAHARRPDATYNLHLAFEEPS